MDVLLELLQPSTSFGDHNVSVTVSVRLKIGSRIGFKNRNSRKPFSEAFFLKGPKGPDVHVLKRNLKKSIGRFWPGRQANVLHFLETL